MQHRVVAALNVRVNSDNSGIYMFMFEVEVLNCVLGMSGSLCFLSGENSDLWLQLMPVYSSVQLLW